jgi:hypothetical protein
LPQQLLLKLQLHEGQPVLLALMQLAAAAAVQQQQG